MIFSLKKSGITFLLIVFGLSFSPLAYAATFTDVPPDKWFYVYVEQLAAADDLDKTQENFRPSDFATRAEAIKVLVLANGFEIDTKDAPVFQDVFASDWFYPYVETAAKKGIIRGYKDASGKSTGYFGPNNKITRAEISKMIVIAENFKELTKDGPHFSDVRPRDWFYSAIETLYNWSSTDGYADGTFRPNNAVNRAEMAKMIVTAIMPPIRPQ